MHIGRRSRNSGFCAVTMHLVGKPGAKERQRNGKDPGDPQPHINVTRVCWAPFSKMSGQYSRYGLCSGHYRCLST